MSPGEGSKEWDSASYNMILVNKTLSFFEDHVNDRPNDPFFAYVALGQVHIPHSPPSYYLDGTPVAGEYENEHLDLLFEMDKVIGSLVSALEDKGLVNDTIIIFSSDNGGLKTKYPGRVLRGFKSQIYEGGHRVPLVMRYDGVFPKNETRSNHFVGLNDLYATLAEIVGVNVPRRSAQDSVSFAKYIQSEDNVQDLRQYLGTWAYSNRAIKGEAIRNGNFKLVRNFLKGQDELYDLKNDIGESKNIINEPQYSAMVEGMRQVLNTLGPCPDDATGEIVLTDGKDAGRVVTCEWFKNNQNRCKRQSVGELMCNSICGRHRKLCSKYPITS
jgi:arylsulfatase A-like enzyme